MNYWRWCFSFVSQHKSNYEFWIIDSPHINSFQMNELSNWDAKAAEKKLKPRDKTRERKRANASQTMRTWKQSKHFPIVYFIKTDRSTFCAQSPNSLDKWSFLFQYPIYDQTAEYYAFQFAMSAWWKLKPKSNQRTFKWMRLCAKNVLAEEE